MIADEEADDSLVRPDLYWSGHCVPVCAGAVSYLPVWQRRFHIHPEDSLSVNSKLRHGFTEVITDTFFFLPVQAEKK